MLTCLHVNIQLEQIFLVNTLGRKCNHYEMECRKIDLPLTLQTRPVENASLFKAEHTTPKELIGFVRADHVASLKSGRQPPALANT